MRPYNTQQRQALLSYLREHAEGLLSAEELWEGMQGERKISLSAVYRNLNMLAIDGVCAQAAGQRREDYALSVCGPRQVRCAPASEMLPVRAADSHQRRNIRRRAAVHRKQRGLYGRYAENDPLRSVRYLQIAFAG